MLKPETINFFRKIRKTAGVFLLMRLDHPAGETEIGRILGDQLGQRRRAARFARQARSGGPQWALQRFLS
jgi:hypothetical protein